MIFIWRFPHRLLQYLFLKTTSKPSLTFSEKFQKNALQLTVRNNFLVINYHLSFSYYPVLVPWKGVWDLKCIAAEKKKKLYSTEDSCISFYQQLYSIFKVTTFCWGLLLLQVRNLNDNSKNFNTTINNSNLKFFISVNSCIFYLFLKSVIFLLSFLLDLQKFLLYSILILHWLSILQVLFPLYFLSINFISGFFL